MGETPHVLVVGGGATGTGIARDLAMRGLDVTLAERGPLASGATGRMHGLLHSGARYAVADPESARACIAENDVLRSIADHCIDDTGGLFVQHPDDPPEYLDRKREACRECSIPVEELSGREAREREPNLSKDVSRALAVPDGAVDPYRLTVANATSAQRHGADILPGTPVTNLETDDDGIASATLRSNDATSTVDVEYVVNAAGAWAPDIAALAGIDVSTRPTKGALVLTDVESATVVNRCRPKAEGDILVPHGTRAVLGATDVPVEDPDEFPTNDDEIELLFEELEPVVPALENAQAIETFWGVRPLFDPAKDGAVAGDITRGFTVLDHERRDDCPGMSTVVGGKFTTHRQMAEAVSDHVCASFGLDRECETASTPLPGGGGTPELASFPVEPPIPEWS
ncbi:FAD-dependent oxidoreductase [Salinibaculum rarum]|uniref:FAD-dependent oxidoreductase n=1 Tax=Salinibaculum rarum TaxID=3058903 RepID=UPI00265FD018|nr:FAD-dependent oxidoreductase [Salinibaculum sp. KK48]